MSGLLFVCPYWVDIDTRFVLLAKVNWRRWISALNLFCLSLGALSARAEGPPLRWNDHSEGRLLIVQPAGSRGLTPLPAESTSIRFTNVLSGDAFLTNAVAHNGSGVAIGDVDRDGWPDVYFCNLEEPNRLYRNLGQWRFQEIDAGPAACADQMSTGAVFADVDGDADLDLLVNGIASGTRLFLNDGKAGWTEAQESGLSRTASPTSMALADMDGDGDLDLYCAHYIDVMHLADPTTRFALGRRDGQWVVTKVNDQSTRSPRWKDRFEALPDGRVRELPEVDGLYRNDGSARFTAIQFEPGTFSDTTGAAIPPFRDWGLAVMFRDMNGDRAPDIYVCNDNASPDRVWINSGRGTFRLIDPLSFRHTSRSSMGVDMADVDRDGCDDVFVLDMLARDHSKRMTQLVKDHSDRETRESATGQPRFNRNTLFLGRRDGTYAEAALMAGVAASDWSWCPLFIDVDLDGYEDLLVTNGFAFDVMDQDSHDQVRQRRLSPDQAKRLRRFHPSWPTRNAVFRNRRDGTFEPVVGEWGFDQMGISYGAALGDLDNDGDLDVVVNNLNQAAGVFRNDSAAPRIAVRLKGRGANTQGIGARVALVGGPVRQEQEMISGGRYMSGDQAIRAFAAANSSGEPLRLEVAWRNGQRTVVSDVRANAIYEIVEKDPSSPSGREQKPVVAGAVDATSRPHFENVSELLRHTHVEDTFDDWARQPTVPKRVSRLGPGLCWFDADADGWEDLIISAGRGGRLAVLMNEAGRKFRALNTGAPTGTDLGAVVAWRDMGGKGSLLVSRFADELNRERESGLERYALPDFSQSQSVSMGRFNPGPLAMADIDLDGDLDLFVSRGAMPGSYPIAGPSEIWLNDGQRLQRDPKRSEPFQSVGLVNGAAFGDLDNDGDLDLALSTEWGAVRIFRSELGQFQSWDAPLDWSKAASGPGTNGSALVEPNSMRQGASKLSELTGGWTGIVWGDFDSDGKLDLAVGNWGLNTAYALYGGTNIRLYHGDLNGDGTIEVIEAWRSGDQWRPVQNRTFLARALPDLPVRFATHQAFGVATLDEILGPVRSAVRHVEVVHFESTVFLNRGSYFQPVPVPRAGQLAPVFAVNVGDLDGDGQEDLFLSQNFFGGISDLTRDDAGMGLWLRGIGEGRFAAVDSSESGIRVHGEQRGAAMADFDHDGRLDIAVSQNGDSTSLYRNVRAKRGLRVRLEGIGSNPDGIGSQVRVEYATGRRGPVRLVQGGSGYWSQDSAVQVLGLIETPAAVWIRWPDGYEQRVLVKEREWEVTIRR